jgi:hypothetical protein
MAVGIVHVTDLHFKLGGFRPHWCEEMLAAFRSFGNSPDDFRIFALAVTGDVADTPDVGALQAAKKFLEEAATVLRLVDDKGAVDWSRIWVVSGNHDYRHSGLLGVSVPGVGQGGVFAPLELYKDQGGEFLAVGLDSGIRGPAARGRVEYRTMRKRESEINQAVKERRFRYRIALIHHHILPLPDRPQEWDSGINKKIKRAIFDEAFKLCENAGLITDFMLRARIHLVLHGHQHKTFAANIRHLDHAAAPSHVMAVIGGPAARDGFEVVRFETLGNVELDRYTLGSGTTFVLSGSYPLWTYDEWKRGEWEKEKRRVGWYRRSDTRARLDATGDLSASRDIAGIYGGDMTPIREIPIKVEVDNKEAAVAALTEVRDKRKATPHPHSGLPPVSHLVEFICGRPPPAKDVKFGFGEMVGCSHMSGPLVRCI